MTLTLIPQPALHGRTLITSPSSRRVPPPSKIKVFFDTLVNLPSDQTSSKGRPRLIYIRDFPTLAPTASVWYPPLLSAVRARRRGPISRPSSPVCNPMSIIFGITPPLGHPHPQNPPSTTNLLGLLSHRPSPTHLPADSKSSKPADWGEDEAAEVAREKRLRERLRKWDKSESLLLEELPKLSVAQEGEANEDDKPDVILLGPAGFPPIPGISPPGSLPSPQADVSFFRTSVLVPRTRSLPTEREVRVARRREINELTMRMGIGAAGGILEQEAAISAFSDGPATVEIVSDDGNGKQPSSSPSLLPSMWEDWGNKIEAWLNVRRIADRAIGETLTTERVAGNFEEDKATLEATVVPWSAVHKSWAIHRSAKDLRSSWLKDTFSVHPAQEQEEAEDSAQGQTDRVIESIKNDEDLDPHEQRLLSCIVDAGAPISLPFIIRLIIMASGFQPLCQHLLSRSIYPLILSTLSGRSFPCLCFIQAHSNGASSRIML
jgi:hypothetical protein